MDKKQYLSMGTIFVLTATILGIIVGIILNLVGCTAVNIISWQYWLAVTLVSGALFMPHLLKRQGLCKDDALQAALNMYVLACAALSVTTLLSDKPASIKTFLIGSMVFWIAFFSIRFILDRQSVKSLLQSCKK